jgi:hypothetical protein
MPQARMGASFSYSRLGLLGRIAGVQHSKGAGFSACHAVGRFMAIAVASCWGNGLQAQTANVAAAETGLQITASADLAYDSNIYRTDKRLAESVDDFILTPSIEAKYFKPVGRHELSLRALVGYDIFFSQSEQNKPRLFAEATGALRFGASCKIAPLLSYRRERADYGDLNLQTSNVQRFVTAGASLSCPREAGLYPELSYLRKSTRNANDDFAYADQDTDAFAVQVNYAKPSLGIVRTFVRYDRIDRPTLGFHNRTYAVGVGLERSVSPLFSADAEIYGLEVDSGNARIAGYNGVGWDVRLESKALEPIRLGVSTRRTVVNDSLVTSGYAIETIYGMSARWIISELSALEGYANWRRRTFRNDPAVLISNYGADRISEFGATLRRKVGSRIEFSLGASRYAREISGGGSRYSANRIVIGAKARF